MSNVNEGELSDDGADDTTRLLGGADSDGAEIEPAAGGEGGSSRAAEHARGSSRCGPDGDARRHKELEKEMIADELVHTAAHITSLLTPVSIAMGLVVLIVKITEEQMLDTRVQSPYLVFREEQDDDTGTRVGKALVNSVAIVGGILTFTVAIFYLYKYNCSFLLFGWLGLSVAMLLGVTGGALFHSLLIVAYGQGGPASSWLAIDMYSFTIFQINFAVVGVVCIFGTSPLIVKQVYLVVSSTIMAWTMSRFFPEWTMWGLLLALSLYDIFAVLTPYGPLKALVELSQDRGDAIPGLVYAAAAPAAVAAPPPAAPLLSHDSGSDEELVPRGRGGGGGSAVGSVGGMVGVGGEEGSSLAEDRSRCEGGGSGGEGRGVGRRRGDVVSPTGGGGGGGRACGWSRLYNAVGWEPY
jgi:presenilin 1